MTRSVIAPSFSSGDTKLNFSESGMVSPELPIGQVLADHP